MSIPWAKLKELEVEILSQGDAIVESRIKKLCTLVEQCRRDPDADESICYHGALALIYQADGSLEQAIRHREEEIAKIRRLHELELQNPTGGYALQNYGEQDLEDRQRRLKALYARKS
jgi:hypothetical protein